MRYEFHPEAFAEFEASAAYYAERQDGLELRFIDAVQTAVRKICDAPERWRIFDGEIRRHLVHVFPYALLYSVEADRLGVHCIQEAGSDRNTVNGWTSWKVPTGQWLADLRTEYLENQT